MSDSQRTALRLAAIGLVSAAGLIVGPYAVPLLLAAWTADILHPAVKTFQRMLGGRRRGAATIVVLLLVAVLVPLAGVAAALAVGVRDLVAQMRAALEGHGTVAGVLAGGANAAPHDLGEWADWMGQHGADAWRAVTLVARTSASALLGVVVFVVALYALAASGDRSYRWLAHRSPFAPRVLSRFTRAFRETGRGLILAGGGTAAVQGLVATGAYLVLGIPRALLLGPITAVCAFVPVIGTALVWGPLAIELVLTGDYARAAVLVVFGAFVGVVDNLIRPALAKYGHLHLPASVVLVSMLGGISLLGVAGALVGPLVVRLAVEALAVIREEGPRSRRAAAPRSRSARSIVEPTRPAKVAFPWLSGAKR